MGPRGMQNLVAPLTENRRDAVQPRRLSFMTP